ncbi:MAG TPA: DUF1801 domain-containing protein, partial [Gemmatimonadaceae bacterium]|nr:DUF1801 domain-containing protein [Gemmatimonadaceae bacterium]
PASVDDLLGALDHPHLPAIRALRALVLGAAPGIREHVKWNAPSFRTTEDFATFNLRAKTGVQLVLHLGAAPRPDSPARGAVQDPDGLLTWKSADRAIVTFADHDAVTRNADALQAIVRQWITFVD